jgi:hypothetical protein
VNSNAGATVRSGSRKPSYTFKIREDGEKKEVQSTEAGGFDWVLYAPYSDKTMMRDVLAYELSNKMGRWAARTKFVEVFVSRLGGKSSRCAIILASMSLRKKSRAAKNV